MYQYVSAVAKLVGGNGRWVSAVDANASLTFIYSHYQKIILILSHPALPNPVSLDLDLLREQLAYSPLSINGWLTANGDNTLPTSGAIPVINTRYAKFSDAVRSGYTITPCNPTISPSSTLPIEDKPDLLVTKMGADYELMYKHCLVNVDGFYHQTDYSAEGLFVTDGMKACLRGKRNEVGLLSFLALGELSFIPITDEMIYTQLPEQQLRYNCYVDTGVDVSNKTVMLVLGGYLHFVDPQVFYRISPSAFGINFANIPLVDRYYESQGVLDMSVLGLEKSPNNPEQIAIGELVSDAVLRRYLTMSQSFFVVLDKTEIFLDSIQLTPSPFPGTYTSMISPVYPLVVGHGKHEVFWPRKEYDRFSVNVKGSWTGTPNYDTVVTMEQNSVADGQLASLGYGNSNAQFLLIGTDI